MPIPAMQQCPKFDSCSAPLCPLDKQRQQRSMLRDERLCYYIRKAIRKDTVTGLDAMIVAAANRVMIEAHLDRALERAMKKSKQELANFR